MVPERLRCEGPRPGSCAGLWDLSAGSCPGLWDSVPAPALRSASAIAVPASALGSLTLVSQSRLLPGVPPRCYAPRGSPRAPSPPHPRLSTPRSRVRDSPPLPPPARRCGAALPSAPLRSAPIRTASVPLLTPTPPPLSGRGQRRRAARGAGPHTAPVPRGRAGRRAPPSLRFPSLPLPPMAALGGTARLAAAAAAQRGAAAAAL